MLISVVLTALCWDGQWASCLSRQDKARVMGSLCNYGTLQCIITWLSKCGRGWANPAVSKQQARCAFSVPAACLTCESNLCL